MSYITYIDLDYLTYTTPTLLNELDLDDFEELTRGRNGYTHGYKGVNSGIEIYYAPSNPRMKTHVSINGSACQYMRSIGYTNEELASFALERGKVKRIDIAVTSHPKSICESHGFTPNEQLQAIKDGRLITNIKSTKEISSMGKVETMYVGSLKKRKRLYRGYDKGLEMGFVSDWLQRFELQTSGDGAQAVTRAVSEGEKMQAVFNRYVRFENPIWEEIMSNDVTSFNHRPEQKEKKTLEWLRDIVAPALAKEMVKNDENDVLDWFLHMVNYEVRNLKSE